MQVHKPHVTPHLYPEANELFYCYPPPDEPYDTHRSEKKLLRAILCRAIQDATGNIEKHVDSNPYSTRISAKHWIFSDEEEVYPFSFRYICLMLELDPEVIRNFLKARKKPLFRGR